MYISNILVNTKLYISFWRISMISICIKTNNKNVISYLMENISTINLDNIFFINKQFSKYNNIIVHYIGTNIPLFLDELTNVIASCIIDNYENKIIHSLLMLNYFYFDDTDLKTIESNLTYFLNSKVDNKMLPVEIYNRYDVLWNDVLRYISKNKSMILEGFIRFRTQDYISILDSLLDFTVNEFILNREYSEFVELLKIYINSKGPNTELVHLIYVNGESILLDDNKNIISLTHNNLESHYLSDISFSSNDYALNSLLSLLPRRIIIHLISPEDEFINTVKLIFSKNVSICTDCNICRTYKLLNNNSNLK